MCRDNYPFRVRERKMSDYDQQQADQVQMQLELAEVFNDLEEGVLLTERQISLLQHCCGYIEHKRNLCVSPVLRDIVNDFGKIFGANK
jgi:hypothetical protein